MNIHSLSLPFCLPLAVISAVALTALTTAPEVAEAGELKIKLGTLAPEGSPWHNFLIRMGQRFKTASKGSVELKIYPGGVAGDEGDMIRKMRIGQLHAATMTGVGLGKIHRSTVALQIPMMIESYDELDYVRERITPKIEAEIGAGGFVVLNWGDAGWVHFFSKTPAAGPEDFKKFKMFVWSGDPEAERAWKSAKFSPIPMSATDVLSGLQTGLIECFATTPLYALSSQWFGAAKHMVEVNWAPLSGATIVSRSIWEKIDAPVRVELERIAKEEGLVIRDEVRQLGPKAVKAMVDRGLTVRTLDTTTTEAWRKTAYAGYADIRGRVVPEAYFDEVERLTKEFRDKSKK